MRNVPNSISRKPCEAFVKRNFCTVGMSALIHNRTSKVSDCMSASLIGYESQAPFLRPVWFRLRVGHASLRSRSPHEAALQALVGVVWRALLMDALERGAADISGFIQTLVHAADDPVGIEGSGGNWCYAVAASFPHWNLEPSIHMRCMMTASLRATATRARRRPFVLCNRMPQAFRADHLVVLVIKAFAAV